MTTRRPKVGRRGGDGDTAPNQVKRCHDAVRRVMERHPEIAVKLTTAEMTQLAASALDVAPPLLPASDGTIRLFARGSTHQTARGQPRSAGWCAMLMSGGVVVKEASGVVRAPADLIETEVRAINKALISVEAGTRVVMPNTNNPGQRWLASRANRVSRKALHEPVTRMRSLATEKGLRLEPATPEDHEVNSMCMAVARTRARQATAEASLRQAADATAPTGPAADPVSG